MGFTFSLKMVGTKIFVPGSWYQDLGTKILLPRSWYQDLATKIMVPRSCYQDSRRAREAEPLGMLGQGFRTVRLITGQKFP